MKKLDRNALKSMAAVAGTIAAFLALWFALAAWTCREIELEPTPVEGGPVPELADKV